MRVYQLVHTLNRGDAISGEALAIRRLLRAQAIGAEIYVLCCDEKVKDLCRSWKHFSDDIKSDLAKGERIAVVLHYSIASPLNDLFCSLSGVARAIVYHNLTPPGWFSRYNTRVAADLDQGLKELPRLISSAQVVVADSRFNAQEIEALGRRDVAVLPLLLDGEKWNVQPNDGIRAVLSGHGGKNLLSVGRIAPNKCLEDVIKAFYFYHHKIERRSRLWLIGNDVDTEIYSFELRRLVSELRLKNAVSFVGSVADCELRSFYEEADLYLCMSEHEGFCVPLLEAMYFGVPIIAYDSSAVGETLGDAGLLMKRKSPAETAELMNIVVGDRNVAEDLIRRGRERLDVFSAEAFSQRLQALLLEPLLG